MTRFLGVLKVMSCKENEEVLEVFSAPNGGNAKDVEIWRLIARGHEIMIIVGRMLDRFRLLHLKLMVLTIMMGLQIVATRHLQAADCYQCGESVGGILWEQDMTQFRCKVRISEENGVMLPIYAE